MNEFDGHKMPGAELASPNGSAAIVALSPRTGREANWDVPPQGVPLLANFGSWPVSQITVDEARRPVGDVVFAVLIVLMLAVVAAAYVGGAFTSKPSHPTPTLITSDPFATVSHSGGKR